MKGGYVMIDCGGLELTSQSEQTVDGIYDQVKEAHEADKFCLACNCEWYDVPMTPVPVMITKLANGTYTATASILQIVIAEDDGITINSLVQ